jgi:hypothetical protein
MAYIEGAGLATLAAPTFGGPKILSRSRVEGNTKSSPLLTVYEPNHTMKPTAHIFWSAPDVTLEIPPALIVHLSLHNPSPNKTHIYGNALLNKTRQNQPHSITPTLLLPLCCASLPCTCAH